MVMTILEARVDRQYWQMLETIFKSKTKNLEPGLVRTDLVRSKTDETLWRIMTVWESQEALTAMRQSGETPTGVVIFQSANAQPTLSIFDIVYEANKPD